MPPTGSAGSGLAWRKAQSSRSNGACVELASADGMVAIRDSKNPDGPILRYTAEEWQAFLDSAKKGELDNLDAASPEEAKPQFVPRNLMESLHWHIAQAVKSPESMKRYMKLFRLFRSTALSILTLLLFGAILFGAGVGAVAFMVGIPPLTAVGMGAGGGAVFVLTVSLKGPSVLRAAFGLLTAYARAGSAPRPEAAEAAEGPQAPE